jgi:hypothetical protein
MDRVEDPFIALAAETLADDFASLEQREVSVPRADFAPAGALALAPVVGRLHGFDLLDQPQITNLAACPGQVLTARTTLPLKRAMIGRDVVLVFDGGNVQAPIIMGVLEAQPLVEGARAPEPGVTIHADGERHVIEAEREIVLRCGDASITLTRAGKVIIKGNYILSRSTGYNKIKGAAIDIN